MRGDSVRIGIVGGSGYSGRELLRILLSHPMTDIAVVASTSHAGQPLHEQAPGLRGADRGLCFSEYDAGRFSECDAVFFCAPHGVSMRDAPELIERGVVVVDIGPDFRLEDAAQWSGFYGMDHTCAELLPEAACGLPELNREALQNARLIACPGCYPTAILLAAAPLVAAGAATGPFIADAKSGVTGAGRQSARPDLLYAEATENIRAYALSGHRHLPEIRQGLARFAGAADADVTFVPHLTPAARGILATVYATAGSGDPRSALEQAYRDEPFVDVLPEGAAPETASVRGGNACRVSAFTPSPGRVVAVSAIDNLVKGAAGQAVQCLNVRFGFDETTGLTAAASMP